MYKNKENERFLEYEEVIVAKAKSVNIPGSDWEDIAQILRIHLWKKFPKFDSGRVKIGYKKAFVERAFVNRVLRNRLLDIVKASKAKKRMAVRFACSTDVLLNSGWDVAAPSCDWLILSNNFIAYGNREK